MIAACHQIIEGSRPRVRVGRPSTRDRDAHRVAARRRRPRPRHHETAAILFGYAAADQERLDIALRLSNRPLAEQALAECRTTVGGDRFDELAALGADTAWRDLPRPVTSAT